MGLETKLTFTAECEDCPASEKREFYGDEWGSRVEEPQEITDFMFDLEFHEGWELERVSYEEHYFYCPRCKAKRAQEQAA